MSVPSDAVIPFLKELEYSLNPNSNAFQMSAGITFVRTKDYTDTTAIGH